LAAVGKVLADLTAEAEFVRASSPVHRRDAENAEVAQKLLIRSLRNLGVLSVSAVNPHFASYASRKTLTPVRILLP
jgi:hypothetical protein